MDFIPSRSGVFRETDLFLLRLICLSTPGHALVSISSFVSYEKLWSLRKLYINSSSMVSKICSFKKLAVSVRYTQHETVLWNSIVFYSNPDENMVFLASSLGFSRIACTVRYSSMNFLKTEKRESKTFNRFTQVHSLWRLQKL